MPQHQDTGQKGSKTQGSALQCHFDGATAPQGHIRPRARAGVAAPFHVTATPAKTKHWHCSDTPQLLESDGKRLDCYDARKELREVNRDRQVI
ncbi:hypothetical protein TorRG33x02_256140 [Trema orientale]|uniref:Uncharacterized protein n=1 Tax=Trema orientale TaxID=63057 RepID=A0A2P5DBM3_TREOI|nr:hypothetical protein TorRG33x02_256140 [Trema orientale]